MSQEICPHARQAAKAVFDTEAVTVLELPAAVPVDADELLALEDRVKPIYYGLLGKVIAQTVELAMTETSKTYRQFLPKRDPFDKLGYSIRYHLTDMSERIVQEDRDKPHMQQLIAVHALRRRLKPGRWPTVEGSLSGGASTAAYNATDHLKNLYRYAAQTDIPDRQGALRRSHKVLTQNAAISSLQLALLNDAQEEAIMPGVEYYGRNHEFRYAFNPLDMALTDRQRAHVRSLAGGDVPGAESVRDVGSPIDTIGCPILLKADLTKRLWQWTVDLAIQREIIKPEA